MQVPFCIHLKCFATASSCTYLALCFSMEKVSEMKAEYFPPREDVILQNEAPTDFYILITGSAVSIPLCINKFGEEK